MKDGWWDVCLDVQDLARTTAFYEALGFETVGGDPPLGWRILQHGNLRLGLFQGHIQETLLNLRGADVFRLAETLRARGLALERGPEVEGDGSAGAWLRDPDGVAVYLNTMPGETRGG